jgi:hypothetical protein
MLRAMRACIVGANFAGARFGVRVWRWMQFAGGASRLGNRRDGVFENELFLGAGFEQDRKLIETTDAAGELSAVQEIDHHRRFLATYSVEKGVLNILWCLFAV